MLIKIDFFSFQNNMLQTKQPKLLKQLLTPNLAKYISISNSLVDAKNSTKNLNPFSKGNFRDEKQ